MTTKPSPYKFCELHMRPSIGPNRCEVCFGAVATPVNDEPVHFVNVSPSTMTNTDAPVEKTAAPLTDPLAQKVVEAAQNYARAVEAVSILTQQVTDAKECFEALQKKLKESIDLREAAQDELRNATVKQ